MGDVEGEGEGSGSGAIVRVRWSIRCMERKGLWIEFWSGSDVRVSVRLRFRVTMRREVH